MNTPTTSSNSPAISATNATSPSANSPVITNVAPTKLPHEVAYQTLLQGILLRLPDVTSLFVQGREMTRDALVSALQGVISAAEDTKAKKNDWHAAVQAERQIVDEATPMREALRALVVSRYGKTSATLREFGFVPGKVRKTLVASKADAIAKAKATRKARSTMGKKQKAQIKGTVDATPPTTNASPAPAPVAPSPVAVAPAPAAAGTSTHGT